MTEPEPLQQIARTYVRFRRRKLSYFSGCDYFRLASHPRVLAAVEEGARRYGLSVSASRLTTGNHGVYSRLEQRLASFFDAATATLVPAGYLTNMVVAQALAGNFSHALIDERAHPAVSDATRFLECPVIKFRHRDPDNLAKTIDRCGPGCRLIVLTDGMFSHDGSAAPLAAYLDLLAADSWLLVDDAHGVGPLGRTGRGSLEHAGVSRHRIIQTVTLSKAFGTFGGAVLGSNHLRERMLKHSPLFTGSTPLPPPLAHAALAALELLEQEPGFKRRLQENTTLVKGALRSAGFPLPDTPGPIVALLAKGPAAAQKMRAALFDARIYPPFIKYPGGPPNGYFRFVISSEHTRAQLERLIQVLSGPGAGLLVPLKRD